MTQYLGHPKMPVVVENSNDKVAIMFVDPGTVSGVARGIFPRCYESAWEGLRQGKWESWEVEGDPTTQAWEIVPEFAEWIDWPENNYMTERGVTGWYLVFEDFQVRVGTGASSRRDLLDPVRVTHACDALCVKRDGLRWAFPKLQQASLAKNFATNERLKRNKMWVVGSEHRRDAVRGMCRFYAHLIGEE